MIDMEQNLIKISHNKLSQNKPFYAKIGNLKQK